MGTSKGTNALRHQVDRCLLKPIHLLEQVTSAVIAHGQEPQGRADSWSSCLGALQIRSLFLLVVVAQYTGETQSSAASLCAIHELLLCSRSLDLHEDIALELELEDIARLRERLGSAAL